MTHTFYCPTEGRHIIYDTESGAVIRSSEIEAYICDALDPCGEPLPSLPEKCPSEIRYELARFASTEIAAAYDSVKRYYNEGLIYRDTGKTNIRVSGEYSATEELIAVIVSKTGISKAELKLI